MPETHSRPPKTVWAFINSAFGLWLLSSVLLAGLSFTYSLMSGIVSRYLERQDNIQKLDTEIAFRLQQWYSLGALPGVQAAPFHAYYNVLLAVPGSSKITEVGGLFFVYPEFKDRPFMSLLGELRALVSKKERAEIDQVAQEAVELEGKAQSGDFMRQRSEFARAFVLSRWTGVKRE